MAASSLLRGVGRKGARLRCGVACHWGGGKAIAWVAHLVGDASLLCSSRKSAASTDMARSAGWRWPAADCRAYPRVTMASCAFNGSVLAKALGSLHSCRWWRDPAFCRPSSFLALLIVFLPVCQPLNPASTL